MERSPPVNVRACSTFAGENSACVGLRLSGAKSICSCVMSRAPRKFTSAPLCSALICGMSARGMLLVPDSGEKAVQSLSIFLPSRLGTFAGAAASGGSASKCFSRMKKPLSFTFHVDGSMAFAAASSRSARHTPRSVRPRPVTCSTTSPRSLSWADAASASRAGRTAAPSLLPATAAGLGAGEGATSAAGASAGAAAGRSTGAVSALAAGALDLRTTKPPLTATTSWPGPAFFSALLAGRRIVKGMPLLLVISPSSTPASARSFSTRFCSRRASPCSYSGVPRAASLKPPSASTGSAVMVAPRVFCSRRKASASS